MNLISATKIGLVVTPPTNLGATLRWCPSDVFFAGLDVRKIGGASNARNDRTRDHGVSRRIFQPNRFVLDIVNDLSAGNCSTTASGGEATGEYGGCADKILYNERSVGSVGTK